jgi:cysteine desulfurase / selenocysteine lyase
MEATTAMALNIEEIREDFPILHQEVYNKPLVYFDNAASTQKPLQVVEALTNYYLNDHANVHRGVHYLSQKATDKFEAARETTKRFFNAESSDEVIFTKGTTDGINLVAYSFGEAFIKEGDEIIISTMEHHSNIVPWQMLCDRKKAILRVIPISDKGELDMEAYQNLLSSKTKLVSVVHTSNALGTINPVKEITQLAKSVNAYVLIDGAQAAPHQKIDVQEIGCDFYVFSGHKIFGPTGIGALYGKREILEAMPPYQGGGEMIKTVTFEKTTYNELPFKFEAGTPNIADVMGFAVAMDYMNSVGYENIQAQENALLKYATDQLKQNFENVRIIGEADNKASVISFLLGNAHPYDVGALLDKMGIAVRTGHHCTEPLMNRLNIPGTVRASFAFYNTFEEIDLMINALKRAEKMLM